MSKKTHPNRCTSSFLHLTHPRFTHVSLEDDRVPKYCELTELYLGVKSRGIIRMENSVKTTILKKK